MNAVVTPAFDYEAALEACTRGERYALRALYDRELRWLLGVALRIVRDRDLAQDVLQEAFLLVWQRADSYQRTPGSARGYLHGGAAQGAGRSAPCRTRNSDGRRPGGPRRRLRAARRIE